VRPMPKYTGCADFGFFEDEDPPVRPHFETPKERVTRVVDEKLATHTQKITDAKSQYDPHKVEDSTSDPFKTLFIARISYDTQERKLKKEFEHWGPIKKCRMIQDLNGKPRGYAFIEFEHERDLKNAYKQGDGKKIDSRRVLVDVERGRTVEGWMPRRLGGGRGPGRYKPSKKEKMAAVNLKREKDAAAKEKEAAEPEARREPERRPERREERKPEGPRGIIRSGGGGERNVVKSGGGDRDRDRDRDRRGGDRDRDRDRDRRGGDRDRRSGREGEVKKEREGEDRKRTGEDEGRDAKRVKQEPTEDPDI